MDEQVTQEIVTERPVEKSRSVLTPRNIILLMSVLLLGLIGLVGYLYWENTNLRKQMASLETVLPESENDVVEIEEEDSVNLSPTVSMPPNSTDIDLPHKNLPGFDITYSSDWVLKIKEFGESEPSGFKSTYFPTCHERCMGLRLTKDSTSFEMVFDIAFDSHGLRCSNSVEVVDIGEGWYRIKDSDGYFYSKQIKLGVTTGEKDSQNASEDSTEWNVTPGTTYEVCEYLGGYSFLEQNPPNDLTEDGGLLLEAPRIHGNPDVNMLREIDGMVRSITGVE